MFLKLLQDFGENMQSSIERSHKKGSSIDEDNKNCLKWNLDYVASLLGSCFPTSHIVVVRPARWVQSFAQRSYLLLSNR